MNLNWKKIILIVVLALRGFLETGSDRVDQDVAPARDSGQEARE